MTDESERADAGRTDRTVEDLRRILMHDSPLPPGLAARLHAHAIRARRDTAYSTGAQRIVLGALAFSAAAFGQGAATVAAGLIVAVLYVWLVDLGDADGEKRVTAENDQQLAADHRA